MDRHDRAVTAFDREVQRRQQASGVPAALVADALTDEIRCRPYRIDYGPVADAMLVYEATELAAGDGSTQLWVRLNVAHPFVQMILGVSPAQRSALEVMLATRAVTRLELDDGMPDRVRWADREVGRRLAAGCEILAAVYADD